jgi:calmodulin-regulated spectrin-associated protein
VVHRGKGIPTLSSVADDKSSARTEAAGRPSNWEEQRRSSYAGRRSRRNSITDDSQLTIENFGGSQVRGGIWCTTRLIFHSSLREKKTSVKG